MAHDTPSQPPHDETLAEPVSAKSDQTIVNAPGDQPTSPPPGVKAEFGHYEIVEELARGGVGIVFKARQKELNRIVALKVLQGGMAASSDQVKRFMHEARSAAKLQHPNIVPIHDFGVFDGQHYFTMDYIEGQSLADIMGRGPMNSREALEIVKEVAEALHYAHEHGVVHRDIKPGNILLDNQGHVKVTDFGLAKESTGEQMNLTVTGQVMGTPRYMSPEQASGKTSEADARSDVFSLGVTLYEMLTGRPAFEGDNVVAILQKILTADPVAPHRLNSKVHRDVETICGKAIEKAPERRYQTALEMSSDITRFLTGEPIEAKPIGPVVRAVRKARRHGKMLLIYAVILFITVNAIILALNARPSMFHLKLQTDDAAVTIDGVPMTPEELEQGKSLRAGQKHTLRVEHEPLYDPQEFTFATRPGEQRSMAVKLMRRMGKLAIVTDPPDTGVTVVNESGYKATFQGPKVEQELPTGEYTLLAHKENFLAQDLTVAVQNGQTRKLEFALPSITLWATPTGGTVLSVPAVADFIGDRANNVVVGDDDGKITCFSGRNGIALWVYRTGNAVQAPLSKADMDGDGLPDVVVGSTDRQLYCLSGKDGHALWTFETKGVIVAPTLLKDVTGDKVPEAFVGSDDGSLYAVSGKDGAELWKFPTGSRIQSCVAWVREGKEDAILVGTLDGVLHCVLAKSGQEAWKVDVGAPLEFPPRIEDLEQNGKLVALLPTPRAPGDARTRTAVSLSERKVLAVGATFPLWTDLDGDGKPEKFVVGDQGTTCYRNDGTTPIWETQYLAVTPYFADVNGDGTLDLVFNNGLDQLLCLSGKDGLAVGRITLEAGVGRGYSLDDVDRDGVPDVVVGAGRKLYCLAWNGGREQWFARAATYYDVPFATAEGKLLTKTSGGAIACYDPAQRAPLWQVETSPQPSPHGGLATGQGLVVDADAKTRRLVARQVADGRERWIAKLPGEADAPIGWPTIIGDNVVVGDGATGVYCFGLADGKERWQQSLPGVMAQAASDGNVLYVCDTGATENNLHCLALADGKSRWRYPVSDPYPSPPALVDVNGDGTKDAIALSDNGSVYALDGKNGKQLWQLQVSELRSRTRHRIVMTESGDTGFVPTLNGDVLCLDLKAGKVRWTFSLGGFVMGEPVLGDSNGDGIIDVIVGTMRRRVHCISGKGDRELWSYEVGAQVRYSAPLLLDGRVFIGTGPPENGLYCLSASAPKKGAAPWRGPWKALTLLRRD